MAYVREGLQAYVRENFTKRLYNPFARFNPMLSYLGLSSVEKLTKLGRPNTAAVFGDLGKLGRGEIRRLGHSSAIFWNYQKYEPNDGSTVAHRDSTPTASTFGEDNAGQIELRWTHYMEPMKVGKSSLDDATGPSAIMSIMDNASAITFERLLKRVNEDMLNGTLTAAQQNDQRWTSLLGLDHVMTSGNTYGRVNRATESDLDPLIIDATTALDTTAISLDLIDVINHGNSTVTGRAAKSSDGQGCNLHIVHPRLWQTLREEAQGLYAIEVPKMPGNAAVGTQRPAIRYGDNWITYDDNLKIAGAATTTTMFSTRLESWVLEVDPRYNFVPQPFVLKSEVEEGGEFVEWSQVHAKLRLSCREPWLNCKTTGLTPS
tara:strand:- start:14587 stop:15711 length:1125 start_codon:yes stop_codon:yes gene_type:complete